MRFKDPYGDEKRRHLIAERGIHNMKRILAALLAAAALMLSVGAVGADAAPQRDTWTWGL